MLYFVSMEVQKLEYFRAVLLEKMQKLLGQAGETVNKMSQDEGTYPDPLDRALSESNRTLELRTRDRERKLIQKIREAIQRIEEGTYGVCEECGEEISESRLRARPEATLCINCKEEQEEIEKKFGF